MKIHITDLPNISNLALDYLTNFEKLAKFYNGDYRNIDNFQNAAEQIKKRQLPLGKLIPVLQEQNQTFGCNSKTLENIDKLMARKACAVVTGQQVGLFGGPLYTIYKTLTTIKLAARLNRNCSGCFVPVFWLASDDHDFREINHIHIENKQNKIQKVPYDKSDVAAKFPAANIKLSNAVDGLIKQLVSDTHPSEFKDSIIALLTDAYHEGATFPQSFGKFIMHLFKNFGLILIDAADQRFKSIAAPMFKQEIIGKSPSTKMALNATKQLAMQNYHGQIHLKDDLLNLFYVSGARHAIQIKDDQFHIKDSNTIFSTDQLVQKVNDAPHQFSPNVVLRPIYQDMLLPTVAYVAGNAEIAYYAQLKGVYNSFGLPMPIIYPRKSATLVATKTQKVLDNYQLTVQQLWNNPENLINEIVTNFIPASLDDRIKSAMSCIQRDLDSIESEVLTFEPTLQETVAHIRAKIHHQIELLDKKIVQATKRRHDIMRQQIYKASHNLYPEQQLQERLLNIVPFLFKYGIHFIDKLYEVFDITDRDHQIIEI